jgi:hypothetical protein
VIFKSAVTNISNKGFLCGYNLWAVVVFVVKVWWRRSRGF